MIMSVDYVDIRASPETTRLELRSLLHYHQLVSLWYLIAFVKQTNISLLLSWAIYFGSLLLGVSFDLGRQVEHCHYSQHLNVLRGDETYLEAELVRRHQQEAVRTTSTTRTYTPQKYRHLRRSAGLSLIPSFPRRASRMLRQASRTLETGTARCRRGSRSFAGSR